MRKSDKMAIIKDAIRYIKKPVVVVVRGELRQHRYIAVTGTTRCSPLYCLHRVTRQHSDNYESMIHRLKWYIRQYRGWLQEAIDEQDRVDG